MKCFFYTIFRFKPRQTANQKKIKNFISLSIIIPELWFESMTLNGIYEYIAFTH